MKIATRTQYAWECEYCGQHGLWYGYNDPTIKAGFAVHQSNCAKTVVVTLQHGDPEPLTHATLTGNGTRWSQSGDGWRWHGECYWGMEWNKIPERYFPMTYTVDPRDPWTHPYRATRAGRKVANG